LCGFGLCFRFGLGLRLLGGLGGRDGELERLLLVRRICRLWLLLARLVRRRSGDRRADLLAPMLETEGPDVTVHVEAGAEGALHAAAYLDRRRVHTGPPARRRRARIGVAQFDATSVVARRGRNP